MRWSSALAGAVSILALACDDGGTTAAEMAEPIPEPEPMADERPADAIRDYVPGPAAMRRLTRSQYVATIRGLFGADLEVLPPTEVDVRVEGLATVGAGTASITPTGFERYEASARQVATAVLASDRRGRILDCDPADVGARDDACAQRFVESLAPQILRRPLRGGEAEAYVELAGQATDVLGNFHQGLQALVSAWLLTPDFLFIQESVQADAPDAETVPLSGLALASRLSFFLWNEGPDAELLAAAADGSLSTDAGFDVQLDRLLTDTEKLERGVRALFTDLYRLDELAGVEKDLRAFPQFTSKAIEDAREQTLRTIVDHLLVKRRDYRDLFTTRDTFVTRHLGPIYNVPAEEGWAPYTFEENSARAGILSHVSFLALQARASRSSPVLRGVFVLDNVLCTAIPPPPADVNFEAIAPESGNGDTARQRLAVHRAAPQCAGCHDVIDPIGLALENFDAIGQFRLAENDAPIDSSGEVFGRRFGDVRGFHQALRDTPRVVECIVEKVFMRAMGRRFIEAEGDVLHALTRDFAADGHDFVGLLRRIVRTHSFKAVSGPRPLTEEADR